MSRTLTSVHVNIILNFPITYKNDSVLANQNGVSTSNSKHGTCTYPKGRALLQMYRVVSQVKRWNYWVW